MSTTFNPFEALPRPGQSKPIPGGFIYCDSWETTQTRADEVTGSITFKFQMGLDDYEVMMSKAESIKDVVTAALANGEQRL